MVVKKLLKTKIENRDTVLDIEVIKTVMNVGQNVQNLVKNCVIVRKKGAPLTTVHLQRMVTETDKGVTVKLETEIGIETGKRIVLGEGVNMRERKTKNMIEHIEVEAGQKDTKMNGTGRRVVIQKLRIEKEKKKKRGKLENLIEKADAVEQSSGSGTHVMGLNIVY
ncbi:hypothetical protein QVD17_00051 [Tagetes erecta]|uniref:Uncharacterized protein n=1 Tax=Tagetes erecta TaxID=13708 RepID=A0AAD8P6M7_TARER|nr:hypothetical protein QVD17_00051 [Tagetes erecta]